MTPSEYKPVFREDVQINQPGGTQIQVNPRFCLSDDSAAALAEMLKGVLPFSAIVISGPPNPVFTEFAGRFSQSNRVAWLQFLDGDGGDPGTRINAGALAFYLPQFPLGDYAIRCIKREYALAAYEQGFGGLPGAF